MVNKDFYEILEINRDVPMKEIKVAFKRLALKYHPDKNKSQHACEKFHEIHMAYQVLSNEEKRAKYDSLSSNDKFDIILSIKKIIADIFNPANLSKIIVDEHVKGFLVRGEYHLLKDYVYKKISDHYLRVDNLEDYYDIFIPCKGTYEEKQYHIMEDDTSYESSYYSSTNTSERDLHLTINTSLEEIYADKIKEVTVLRHRYGTNKNDVVLEERKFYIELRNDKLVLKGEGDEYIDKRGIITRSDIVVKIKCKKHHFIQRVNDYDLLLFLPISLNELFNGFKKTFIYFGDTKVTISATCPFKEYNFDGDKIVIERSGFGLPKSSTERGSLYIYLLLDKKERFYEDLRTYFS